MFHKNYISIKDKNYPPLLKEIYGPPEKLFYKGDINLLEKTCLGVVGTRKNTDYGDYITEQIIEELSVLDIAIVSGLAKGIDTIAHKASLKHGLPTIAVLGSGLGNIYPPENKSLAQELSKTNLILSEYEQETAPLAAYFPQRNRIISGLSLAVLVIEAPIKSGALITARTALDEGREVFVVPGDIDRENSLGIIELLKKGGAYPISSGKDIIDFFTSQPSFKNIFKEKKITRLSATGGLPSFSSAPPQAGHSPPKQPNQKHIYKISEEENLIISCMRVNKPISLDEISLKTKLPLNNLLSNISILEINGFIANINGRYIRKF
ncbi:DNA-protecting protein DprA [Candidatus Peregrinibacteria bacterium]|nr:DNA-protecting protein DprA [Candidatus Peregrinibacteria bacterium]